MFSFSLSVKNLNIFFAIWWSLIRILRNPSLVIRNDVESVVLLSKQNQWIIKKNIIFIPDVFGNFLTPEIFSLEISKMEILHL